MTADGDRDDSDGDRDESNDARDDSENTATDRAATGESDRPVALVTGAAGGIGRAVTRIFCAAGWRVYATDVSTDGLDDLADDIAARHGDSSAGGLLETAVLDVTVAADRERVLDRIERESGRLDCLLNNAGFAVPGAVVDADGDFVRDLYEVLVHGPTALVRAAFPLLEASSGRILTVTSSLAHVSFPGIGHYAAAKAAAARTTETLRIECRDTPVTVAAVEPAWVETEFTETAADRLPDPSERSPAFAETYRFLTDGDLLDGGVAAVPPERVARTIYRAATADSPRGTYPVGWPAYALRLAGLFPAVVADPIRNRIARGITWIRQLASE
jgi:NAD(P)-dependent dehydrogenase (short-subunit alcohol dehydrogenase family)